jgi:D-3-phosphoglycerate dehydrogenase
MVTIGYDPLLSADVASKMNIELVSLDEIYRRSDFITVHTPLNDETRSLLNDETIAKCKKGVRLINCARGGIIDEGALLRALESGHVAGAALDVFVEEPPKDFSLAKHPKVVAVPHLGASTEEAQEKVAVQIAHQIADALKGRGIVGAVNAVALQAGIPSEIVPFVTLAEKLGLLLAQVMKGQLKDIVVQLSGEMLHKYSELLKAAVLRGLFSKMYHEPVNYINAPHFAQSMGVMVGEMKNMEGGDFTNLLTVKYTTDAESRSFAGTVFAGKYPKIVRLDRYSVEGTPEGIYLYYTNIDRPGMLASVGTILAKENINIGGLSLGRTGIGEKALTVVNVDTEISEAVLQQIRSLDGVFDARVVSL